MPTSTSVKEFTSIASGDRPVLETIAKMTVDSLENCHLDARSYFIARIAALAAMDAPPMSYLLNVASAADVLQPGDLRDILVALTPVIGTARTTSAAGHMIRAFAAAMDISEALVELEEKEKAATANASRRRAA